MLRTTSGMKFQASRNSVRTPLKHFPKPFKANQHSSFYFTLASSPKLSIPKAMKHSSQDSKKPLPNKKASSKGFLQEIASLFHVSHDEDKPAPSKPERSRSGRNVLMRLASEHECTEEEENRFMESIDHVDLEELQRLISRMRESTRIEEAIQKIGEQADMIKDQASHLELLIVELLIYKGEYVEAYKKVLPLVAKPPKGDQTAHLLLGVIYQKVQEVEESQQGEASKGH